MPRVCKCRKVCSEPENRRFHPDNPCGGTVALTVEELETIRLCDREGLEQTEAADMMNISRATFQRLLYQARAKTADALCSGKTIVIGGGNYELAQCGCGRQRRCKNCRFALRPDPANETNHG